MNLQQKVEQLQQQYNVIAVVDMDPWHDLSDVDRKAWFREVLTPLHREEYQGNDRLVFTLSRGDVYKDADSDCGIFLKQFQRRINEIDISNFFVILVTHDNSVADAYKQMHSTLSTDPVPFSIEIVEPVQTQPKFLDPGTIKKQMSERLAYNQLDPLKIDLEDLTQREQFLLKDSKRFCIYPWIHIHAYPTGEAYPCCMAEMQFPVGSMRKNTIKEIWNQNPMKEIRRSMLTEKSVDACVRCYEQESHGFVSGRQSANKHFGHHIDRVSRTDSDGTFDEFELVYWDIRFSNLCNLKCRSCGHIFSSQWAQDQVKMSGPDYLKKFPVLNYAGRFETDAWDQLVEHIEHAEQIYFAGGEPLLMEEHYKILDELVRRKKFNVRLIYNTNFTHTDLKGQSVFEYWKQFDSVSVGASLDAAGSRGEYIRKGTDWAVVEQNRREMLRICPEVDFYISPTLSIMNALHLPDFHRDWVEKGLIRPKDLNVNILQDPAYYRIDIAPSHYKQQIKEKFEKHIEWLKGIDEYQRATQGFESAINFMMATDNTSLIPQFWTKTKQLDEIRRENLLDVLPELAALK